MIPRFQGYLTAHIRHRADLTLMVLVLLLAAGLRFHNLEGQSLWFDEGVAVYAAVHPLSQIPRADPTNPPLYFYLMHFWILLVGRSAFAVRALAVLLGVALVAAIYILGRRWFSSAAGVLAALMAALSPLMWWYSQEARMYNLMGLAVIALIFMIERLNNRPTDRWAWFAALVVEAVALFSHNLSPSVVGWVNIALGLNWLRGRHWRVLRDWLALQAFLGFVMLPWLELHRRYVRGLASVTYRPPDINALLEAWESLFTGSWLLVGAEPAFTGLARLLLVLAAAGLALVMLRRAWRWPAALLVTYTVVILAICYILLTTYSFAYHARYLIMISGPIFVLVAAGAVAAWHWHGIGKLLAGASLAAALGMAVFAYGEIGSDPFYWRDDARGLTDYYKRALGPDDAVVSPYSYAREYVLWYYGVGEAQLVEMYDYTIEEARDILNARLPPGEARVEIVDWTKTFGDRRNALACLLEENGRILDEKFWVVGLGTQGYRANIPLSLPPAQGLAADFGVLQLEGAAFTTRKPADRARCVMLDWRLLQDVPDDLGVVITVTNPLGWEIVRADVPLLRQDFAPSRFWGAGERARSFAVLHLPAGTPPGEYPIRARAYAVDTLAALNLRIDGAPAGKDFTLGTLTVTPPIDAERAAPPDETLTPAGAALGDGLILDAFGVPVGPIHAGETLHATLRWTASESLTAAPILYLRGAAGWQVESVAEVTVEAGGLRLDWREIAAPADAQPGPAELGILWRGEGVLLAPFDLKETDRLMNKPAFDYPIGIQFPGVGELVGFSMAGDTLRAGSALPLTLVWQAAGTPGTAYTVFTHLLDTAGRLIAGHDSPPAGGSRPTTGWLPPEYIVDEHTLTFLDEAKDYTGPARLEVGLYDPETGARVPLASGEDHVILPVEIMVVE